ncbi:MAG: Spy/CpxP family protein refolding chaperone [Chitinispirillales bacterium]|nr:Spy/CpxP family protein refolding chaperone [Chitinispirillales bacterium]
MRSRMFLWVALLSAVLVSATASADDKRGDHPARKMLEELNLSAEQEARFKEINSQYAPVRRENAQRIEELREKINQEILRDKPSKSMLIQYAGTIGELQKKMSLSSVNHLLEVKSVLTPEQFKTFVSMSPSATGGRRGGGRRGDGENTGGGE